MGILDKLRSSNPTPSKFDDSKSCTTIRELMEKKLSKRDKKDRIFFEHSVKGLSALCIIGSTVMNTSIRRSVMVYESWIVTTLGISTVSSATNFLTQYGFVQWPLLEGRIPCTTCAVLRGALIQGFTACILPGTLSFFLSAIAADTFKATKVPDLNFPPSQEFRSFWNKTISAIRRPSLYMLAFQTLVGGFIAYKEKQISLELLSTVTKQEKDELWHDVLRNMDNSF